MAKKKGDSGDEDEQPTYERVLLSELRRGRRGKHHKLLQRILENLEGLPDNSAMKIPLRTLHGVSLANLRSAVNRATSSRHVEIATYSDGESFYIWRKSATQSGAKKP
jgi:hypothetical protein